MSMYNLMLFVHLLAVVSAFSAGALIELSLVRLRRADRVERARECLGLIKKGSQAMPIIGLVLFVTGGYMAQVAWSWTTPWVDIAIVGLVALLAIGGAVLKPRLQPLGQQLGRAGAGPLDGALAAALRNPVVWIGSRVQPLLAIAVIFVMVMKPGFAVGVAALGIAVAIAGILAVPTLRTAAGGSAPAEIEIPAAATKEAP